MNMDYTSKHIDPDVLDFYRPSHINGNRLSNSGQHCHSHDQDQHPHQQTNTSSLHSKTSITQRVPVAGLPHGQNHSQITRSYPQGRPYAYGPQQTGRTQQLTENYRHNHAQGSSPSICASTISNCASISNAGSSYASLSSGCKPVHKTVSSGLTSLRAVELRDLLREKIAMLPGGRTRTGGPILCFPANCRADLLPLENLYRLVRYLTYLPEENVKKLGFAVIIDMRSGTTWHSVKPILKVIEECIGGIVAMTYIIKPDKYLVKQKVQMSIGKFSFETQMVSVEALFHQVDPSQLTVDLEGSLPYNHEEWIQIRCCLEEFFMFAHDMSDKFSQLYCFLDQKQNPETVEESKHALENHRSVRLKIMQAPVPALEAESDRLSAWLNYGVAATASAAGASQGGLPSSATGVTSSGASYVSSSWVSNNPDFKQLIPQVRQTVSQLYEFRAHLQQKWENGRTRLEQIYQLRLFEDDASRMTNWLDQQRIIFLTEHADIGDTSTQTAELHNQHRQFLQKCTGVREQVSRLTGIARMLADTGHFAGQQMLKQANQLEYERKSFTTALDERTRVLQLSASFYTRAETFLNNCTSWEANVRHINGTNVGDLNQSLRHIQDRWQDIQRSHEEACTDGRAMVDLLSAPVTGGSHTSLTAAIDYSQGRKHCTDLVHELWAWYKRLERVFTERKCRLTSRLALLMFKEDVGQVLAWLTEHGEPFLQRQTAVGKSSQRAEQLYNAHMQFEQVAANTLTNADKLISAADELAVQAENPREIRQEAGKLQQRITTFTNAVDSRRETLDLACGFYGHTKEVFTWMHGVTELDNPGEHFPPNIEGMEDELTNFHRDRAALEVAVERVVTEGELLVRRLQDSEEVTHLQSILTQVDSERTSILGLLTERQVRLDLCLQLRLFEADVHASLEGLRREVPALASLAAATNQPEQVGSSLPSSSPDLCWINDPQQAPNISILEEVNSSCMRALPTVEEVLVKGGELIRAFESVGVNFPAGGPGSSDSGVGDSSETAVERAHRLIGELSDSVAMVDDINERVSNELDWRRLHLQSCQVLQWIGQCETILYRSSAIPASLSEAETLQVEHDKFQPVLNAAHPEAVQCAARASYLLQSVGSDHPRRSDFLNVAETVALRWQKLVYAAEEKHKLLIAATNWYKTSEQVISVLRSLEKDYRREEDWCRNEKAISSGNVENYLNDLLSKHGEQKEAFLKACILARRTSELFIKYLHRQPPSTAGRVKVEDRIRAAMTELMTKEQAVLEAWAAQRRRFDDCVNFISIDFKMSDLARRLFQSVRMGPGGADWDTPLPIVSPQSPFFNEAKRACHNLKILVEAGSVHTNLLILMQRRFQACLASNTTAEPVASAQHPLRPGADPTGQDASTTAKMRATSTGSNRTSVSSTGSSGYSTAATESASAVTAGLTDEQRKQINRRANILKELITTERSYVVSLRTCIDTFLQGSFNPPADLPKPSYIAGKESIVFGNLAEICDFHENIFEPEIRKYASGGDFLPEDVGHCFVSFGDRLAGLYVEYCVNKEESMQILLIDTENFFQKLQLHFKLSEPLQSFLIKPVQRITKYQLLLRELRDCCDRASAGELKEGHDAMMGVPKKANEALHLRMLTGLPDDLPITCLGDVILQDQFVVWEPKQLIKKGRERRVFLFDICLVLGKECPIGPGDQKMKYQFKSRFLLAELNITEHIEGDQCKFALWTGQVPPVSDYRLVLKATNLDVKQNWVRAIREAMRERMFSVQSLHQQNAPSKTGDFYIRENYQAQGPYEISVSAHQIVQVIQRTRQPQPFLVDEQNPEVDHPLDDGTLTPDTKGGCFEWALVRFVVNGSASSPNSPTSEGYIPTRLIGSAVFPTSATLQQPSTASIGGRRSVRRWLAPSSFKARSTGPNQSAKRGSRADLVITEPTISVKVTSNQHEMPTVGQLKVAGDALLDNVSEESVELELPPPMVELQALPTANSTVNSHTDEETISLPDSEEHNIHISDANSALNISTVGDLHTANSELNLLRTIEVTGDASDSLMESVPVLSGLPSDVSLGQLRLHGALRVATRLLGAPRLSDLTISDSGAPPSYSPTPPPLFSGTMTNNISQDEELLRAIAEESTDLCFVNRYLMLFDRGLVIADAALEVLRSDGITKQLKCQFRHFLSFSQIAILEDIGVAGSRPTSDQVLWFCVSERPRRSICSAGGPVNSVAMGFQSHLCHVLAPQSPEIRLHWLSELNNSFQETKRQSIASGDGFINMDPATASLSPALSSKCITSA